MPPPESVRVLHADAVFPGEGPSIRDAALVTEGARIVAVGPASDVLPRHTGVRVERLRGVLLPGLINAHTHLELSYLRGEVPGGGGFFPWVERLMRRRAELSGDDGLITVDNESAIQAMTRAGVVAVGDISNGLSSVHATARAGLGGIVFHEVFGFDRGRCMDRLGSLDRERASVVGVWPEGDLAYAPTPHTLYTTHPDVVQATLRRARETAGRASLHLAEHGGEREFLEKGTGPLLGWAASLKLDISAFPVPKLSPIAFADHLGLIAPDVMLVHLTNATRAELDLVASKKAPVVLCPRSNLYIELRLPPVLDVLAAGIVPALGTDSLASNTTLDPMAEARAILERFPTVTMPRLLEMVTLAGAKALGRDDLGRFTPGARPGVLHVEVDLESGDPLRRVIQSSPSARKLVIGRR